MNRTKFFEVNTPAKLAKALSEAEPAWTNTDEPTFNAWYAACVAVSKCLLREFLITDSAEFLRACHKHHYCIIGDYHGDR